MGDVTVLIHQKVSLPNQHFMISVQTNVQDKKKTARMRLKREDVKRKKLMENVVKNISRKIVKRHVDTARIRTTKRTTKNYSIQSTRPWLNVKNLIASF